MESLYDILHVDSAVDQEGLRAAFKRRVLEVHPDKGGSKDDFRRVMEAFETLYDASRRAKYDRSCCTGNLSPGAGAPGAKRSRLRKKRPCPRPEPAASPQPSARPQPGDPDDLVTELTGLIGFLRPDKRKEVLRRLTKDLRAKVRKYLLSRRRMQLRGGEPGVQQPGGCGTSSKADGLDAEQPLRQGLTSSFWARMLAAPRQRPCEARSSIWKGRSIWKTRSSKANSISICSWYGCYVARMRMVAGIVTQTNSWNVLRDAVDAQCLLVAMQGSVEAAAKTAGQDAATSLQSLTAAIQTALSEQTKGDSDVCKRLRLQWCFECKLWGASLRGPWVKDFEVAFGQRVRFEELMAAKPESRCPCPLETLDEHFEQVQQLWGSVARAPFPATVRDAFGRHRERQAVAWAAYQRNAQLDAMKQEEQILLRIGALLTSYRWQCQKAATAARVVERGRKYAEKLRMLSEARRREFGQPLFKPPMPAVGGPLKRLVR